MKKTALLALAALVLTISLPVSAQQLADVPTDHWAYAAVQQLAQAGVIQGYPDGTFSGKSALTRYEFAAAINRAIPAIQSAVKAGISAAAAGQAGPAGARGPQGPAGPQGPRGLQGPAGVSADQIATMQALVDQFKTELAGIGVNVAGLKRDIASLQQRVAAVEREQSRVKWNGEINLIARGEGRFQGLAFDRDGRTLAPLTGNPQNVFRNIEGFTDFQLSVKGKVSDTVSATALIDAGNYLPFALNNSLVTGFTGLTDKFVLWNAYADAAVKLPLAGKTALTVGRFPFQLTPYTMKFVDPDSYNKLSILDNGDFVVDGVNAQMSLSPSVAFSTFAAKSNIGNSANHLTDLIVMNPAFSISGIPDGYADLGTFFGGRAVIGTPWNGNVGLTYLNANVLDPSVGTLPNAQTQVYGADLNLNAGSIGISGEWAKSDPNAAFVNGVIGLGGDNYGERNTAWNGKLAYSTGKLGVAAGYTQVEANYAAPGSWNRMGNIVNPTNIKGIVGNVTYAFAPGLSFTGDVQFLQPVDGNLAVNYRWPSYKGHIPGALPVGGVNKINYWKAGLKYSLTSSDNVDLGYEQVEVTPVVAGGLNQVEKFVTLGVGHTFSPGASLKVLYQIIETTGDALVFTDSRGSVASAQIQFKY